MQESREAIGAAIGRIPSGCSILTVAHGEQSTGMLVSWVQQAAFDPPSITVCIKQGRPVAGLIDQAKRFLLNVIGEDTGPLFKHFGKGFALEENAFADVPVKQTEFGPAIESCIAFLGCRVKDKVSVGDHDLYIAEVVAGDQGAAQGTASGDERKPFVHIRKSGLSY